MRDRDTLEKALSEAQRLLFFLHSRPVFDEPDVVDFEKLAARGYSRDRVKQLEEQLDKFHSDFYFSRLFGK